MTLVKPLIWLLGAFALVVICMIVGAPAPYTSLSPESSGLGIALGGMIVSRENLANLFISLKTTFNNAFDSAPSVWQKVAMKVPSTTRANDYTWLSNFPRMQKWIGEKVVKALAAFKYTIENDDWEATVGVKRNDMEDDLLGIYEPQARGAGMSSKQLPDEIVMELVNGAFTNFCYDGQFFCDTDHPVNGASVSNKTTKKLSNANLAAVEASIGVAYSGMQLFTDDEGRPLNTTPNILLVGPLNRSMANLIAKQDKLADNSPNPYHQAFEVVVDARITGYKWFLLDTTKAVMPFIYQERKAPVFVSQTDLASDDVFTRAEYKFGAEARAAGGYGFWQLAYGSDGTVA